jgi:CheY-like chemotaxis protein/HPt (histidine-containing phosphotransfer) domain-containing protein
MSSQPNPTRVLVIDDDAMSRELLSALLAGEGYAVESAHSGEAALAFLRQSKSPLDLVLSDVQMPGISGAQLARELRGVCGPATALLAMSGSQPPAATVSLFDGFLLKPFKMEQVAAALRARIPASGDSPAKKEKSSSSGPARAKRPVSNQLSTAAPAPKTASKNRMNIQTQQGHARSSENAGPVLNETIYRQLAGSMPAKQLNEMYVMCVNDARRRIAGMRTLAADHDTARFVREAHAIKGGCGMLGATELHRMAAQLEANGPGDGPPGVNSLDELSAACDRLERMLGSRV